MSESNPRQTRRSPSPWSPQIATIAGIPLRVNVTFALLIIYIWIIVAQFSGSLAIVVAFVLGTFVCVTLHELGHALVARQFGIQTTSITLYPIGGVAMIAGEMRPIEELCVAIAGPLVNFAIALILAAALFFTGNLKWPDDGLFSQGLLTDLLMVNVLMILLNLVPALPMDGGRVLRALLAMILPKHTATTIAAWIARGLSLLMMFVGIVFKSFDLVIIGLLVSTGATQEVRYASLQRLLSGRFVGNLMALAPVTLNHGDSVRSAVEAAHQTQQQWFAVRAGGEFVGVVSRRKLEAALARFGGDRYVAPEMSRAIAVVGPNVPAEEASRRFGGRSLIVVQDDQVLGVVVWADVLAAARGYA